MIEAVATGLRQPQFVAIGDDQAIEISKRE
jgi:hypothetical protein